MICGRLSHPEPMHRRMEKPTDSSPGYVFFRRLHGNILAVLAARLAILMGIYSFSRLLFWWYNRDLFPGMTSGRMGEILLGGLRFDLAGLLYLNALVILLTVVPLRIRFHRIYQRTVTTLFLVINGAGLMANLADMVYYRTTLRRTTLMVLDQFSNETNFAQLIPRFVLDFSGVALLFLCLMVGLIWLVTRSRIEGPQFPSTGMFYGGGLFTLVLTAGLVVAGIRGGFRHSTRPITVSNAMAYATVPEDVALVVNTPFALIRTSGTGVIRKVDYFPDEESLRAVYDPEIHPAPEGPFQPLNVVVIIVESLSMELSGFYNHWIDQGRYQGYTPFLDSLARQSLTWQYGFANGRKSIEAMPSILCAIPSIEVPFVLSHYSNNRVNGLPGLLREKGYSTAFFHGAPNGSMGFDAFAKQAGFERYFGMREYGNDADMDGMWGIWDMPFLRFFGQRLNDMPEPFCASVFTVSSHHPFEVPEEYQGRFRKGQNKMHEAVQYTDLALKRFFQEAARQDWFNRTLFVITADHVSSEITLPEYKTVWGQYAVPVIFHRPGMVPDFRRDQIVQQTDIMPTILGMLGYDKPYVAFGRDLTRSQDSTVFNYVSPAYQLITPGRLYRYDGSRLLAGFDYRKDPRMEQNLMGTERPDARVTGMIQARIQQYNNRMVGNRLTMPGQARLW